MKALVLTRQDSNFNCLVFQDSSVVVEIDDTKDLSIENRGVRRVEKTDFCLNVNGATASPALRYKSKAVNSVVMIAGMDFPIHVVVSLAHRRDSR